MKSELFEIDMEKNRVLIAFALICSMVLVGFVGCVSATDVTGSMVINTPGVYILQNDIINSAASRCIDIQSSDVIFDGNGHTIDGTDAGWGISLVTYAPISNVTIKNVTVQDWYSGIEVNNGKKIAVLNSNAYSNTNWGIHFINSPTPSDLTIIGNSVINGDNFGMQLDHVSFSMISDNIAQGNSGGGLFSEGGGSNNTFINNTASGNGVGFGITDTNSTIIKTSAYGNSGHGITVDYGGNNLFENVSIRGSGDYGIYVYQSSNNIFMNLTSSYNRWGLFIQSSSFNKFANSNISSNTAIGLNLDSGSQNNIISNNIFNNTNNVGVSGVNIWNTTKTSGPNIIGGSYLGGNYWANPAGTGFSQTCIDANGDGISDSAYTIGAGNIDNLPLTTFTSVQTPTVNSITPTSGPLAGGTSIIITGTGFIGATSVTFGSTPATSYTVNNATQITATSPAGSGTVDVRVTTPGGTSVVLATDQFTYQVQLPPGQTPCTSCTVITNPGVYGLQNDIVNSTATKCIDIRSSDVIFDGNGHTIDGTDTSGTNGFYLYNYPIPSNVTIKNVTLTDWYSGIEITYGKKVTVSQVNASSNINWGIHFDNNPPPTPPEHNITGNRVSNNGNMGIQLSGISFSTVSNNILDGSGGMVIDGGSSNNIFINNSASGSWNGISLTSARNNTFIDTTANGNKNSGINIGSASYNNRFVNTTTRNNPYGIGVAGALSDNNIFLNITSTDNENGIYLGYSNSTIITESTFSKNSRYGIYLDSTTNNTIYNNFLNNTQNVRLSNSISNTWNTAKTPGINIIGGSSLGGNYWANPSGTGFSQTTYDANGDGISESAYTIGTGNIDNLPLTNNIAPAPVASFTANVTSGTAPLIVKFTDTSTGSPISWAWSFGDGTYETTQNPTHTFTASGSYAISLNTTNSGGSNNTVRSNYILVTPPKPMPDFSADITSGTAPLSVSFTDASSNSPTGWAWFFGDENYLAPWTPVTTGAGWSGRYGHSSVLMPDGSIVLMGGDAGGSWKNDVWRSTDNGATWIRINASAGWTARVFHNSVVMPDGSIVLMGGVDSSGWKNDVWRSTDNGATWIRINASAGWSARSRFNSVAMPDGSIVLMSGYGNNYYNDVWQSTDNGATWTQITASAGWSIRYLPSSVVMPDGSIVLMGGYDGASWKNDVWRSIDNGAIWTRVNASAGWSARSAHNSVVMPDGSIVLMGGWDSGGYKNDVWRSTDNGATWIRINTSAGWTARAWHSSVVTTNGGIVLMGGYGNINYNDVWRFMPTGSSVQNPIHIYTTPGIYPVALQAYNSGGHNSVRKMGYITVKQANQAPVLGSIGNKAVAEGTALMFTLSATDPDNGHTLTYSATGLPTGATLIGMNFSWIPTYEQAGTYPVTFTVSDGSLTDTEAINITVSESNRAPELGVVGDKNIAEGSALTFTLVGTDADGQTLTYSSTALPAGATLTGADFAWTPTFEQAGSYPLTFTVSDGVLTDTEAINITVSESNRAPELGVVGDKNIAEGSALTFTLVGTDADGQTLTYSSTALPAGATLTGADFAWTPTFEQAGSYPLTFTVSDGVLTDTEAINITVSESNRAPELGVVGDKNIAEGSALTFTLVGTDADGQALTYSSTTLPSGATLTGAAFTWTPTFEQAGTYPLTFTVSDGTSH